MPSETGLETLLDAMRASLLAGDLVALADLAGRIEAAPIPPGRAVRADLRRKADENRHLLAGAIRGVRAARQRLREVTEGAQMRTYDAEGRVGGIAPASPVPLRRA